MRLDPSASVIVLPVEVDGLTRRRTIKMVLDTGATYVMIPRYVAEAIGYDLGAIKRKVAITTVSAVEDVPFITLKHVKALGVEVKRIPVVCHDLPAGSGVEGLLGLSFLKHLNLDLYFMSGFLRAHE